MTIYTSRRRLRLGRILLVLGLALALIVVVTGVGGYLIYRHLNSNITVDNSANNELRHTASSAVATTPENILVLGSDTRVGQGGIGGSVAAGSGGSDVTMLVHIAADRQHAIIISMPRDTWSLIPSCKQPNGTMSQPHYFKFNSAYNVGGPACTIKLFEEMTGIPVDHFIVVTFSGFENIVNAIGGVEVCVSQPIHDPAEQGEGSGLELSAGDHLLMGTQALEFVRVRHNVDDGSDTSRIARQHAFLASMVRKVEQDNLLFHPIQLLQILDAATKSMTTDPGLGSLSDLKSLAGTLRRLKASDITFLTVPWVPRGDGANVLVNGPVAAPIFSAIIHDTVWPLPPYTPPGPPLTEQPMYIHVMVLNGTGITGRAKDVAAQLEALGYDVIGTGDAPATATTEVEAPPGFPESTRTLSAAVVGSTSAVEPSMAGGSYLTLVLGSNYTAVRPVTVPTNNTATSSGSTVIRNGADASCVS